MINFFFESPHTHPHAQHLSIIYTYILKTHSTFPPERPIDRTGLRPHQTRRPHHRHLHRHPLGHEGEARPHPADETPHLHLQAVPRPDWTQHLLLCSKMPTVRRDRPTREAPGWRESLALSGVLSWGKGFVREWGDFLKISWECSHGVKVLWRNEGIFKDFLWVFVFVVDVG